MLAAAKASNADPSRCIYLGDAHRDIEAGNAAGMTTLVALWGYISKNEKPTSWAADGLLKKPQQTIEWIGYRSNSLA